MCQELFQRLGRGHGLGCGNAGGAGRIGEGEFPFSEMCYPCLGCVIPVWFKKNQWDWTFLAKGAPGWLQGILGMSPECHWNVTGMSLECHSKLQERQ